ncbi:MAG TPA: hypothetical protein VIQ31_12710 [Phormidium sp.]
MSDNKDTENTSSSTSLWKNPAVLGPVLVALIGVPGIIISNLDKIKSFFTPSSSSTSLPTGTPSNNSPTITPSPATSENKKFFVIAGESNYRESLAKEPKRVKLQMGDGFNYRYRDIKLCLSVADSKKLYLVIGSNLQQKDAELLKNHAIDDKFRQDTYILEESAIDFKPADCEVIVYK